MTKLEFATPQTKRVFENIESQKYWMAYMEMKPRQKKILNIALFVVNTVIVFWDLNATFIVNFLGSTLIPLMIYWIPGYLYYKHYELIISKKSGSKRGKFGLYFAILGGVCIFAYSSS